MTHTVGFRQAEQGIVFGKLFSGAEALRIGLVDEIVPAEQLLQRAADEMKALLAIPGMDVKKL